MASVVMLESNKDGSKWATLAKRSIVLTKKATYLVVQVDSRISRSDATMTKFVASESMLRNKKNTENEQVVLQKKQPYRCWIWLLYI